MSWTMRIHYGNTNDGIPPVEKTIQPIAAIMKPMPAYSLILIFWYPLWNFVNKMVACCTWQTTIFLVSITKYIFSYQAFFTINTG